LACNYFIPTKALYLFICHVPLAASSCWFLLGLYYAYDAKTFVYNYILVLKTTLYNFTSLLVFYGGICCLSFLIICIFPLLLLYLLASDKFQVHSCCKSFYASCLERKKLVSMEAIFVLPI
jgi:hypothetical protein